jgi:hypothetical protein
MYVGPPTGATAITYSALTVSTHLRAEGDSSPSEVQLVDTSHFLLGELYGPAERNGFRLLPSVIGAKSG